MAAFGRSGKGVPQEKKNVPYPWEGFSFLCFLYPCMYEGKVALPHGRLRYVSDGDEDREKKDHPMYLSYFYFF